MRMVDISVTEFRLWGKTGTRHGVSANPSPCIRGLGAPLSKYSSTSESSPTEEAPILAGTTPESAPERNIAVVEWLPDSLAADS